ncbi:MAG: DUF4270 family protein [Breznakibacter sp.]
MKYRKRNASIIKTLSLVGVISAFFSCSDDNFSIGKEFIRSNVYTELIDTVTLRLSTFRPNSIQTSGKSVSLIGNYFHSGLGQVTTTTYVDYSNQNLSDVGLYEEYDSLTLVMQYSGYCEGDTIVPFSFHVHRLADNIEPLDEDNDVDVYYNNTNFAYDTAPLASFTIIPRPNMGEKLILRMPDELGNELWNLALDDDLSEDDFLSAFKGFAIKADPSANTVLAFNVTDTTSLALKLYSHVINDEREVVVRQIGIKSTSTQFNNITSDLSEIPVLKTLSEENRWIPEYQTDAVSVAQAGSGFMVRVDFPYLSSLKEATANGRIVKALLIISPDMGYQSLSDLPETINIGTIDKVNYVGSYLTDSYSTNLTGNLYKDYGFNEGTCYTFDVTSYINSRVSEDVILPDQGLFLTIPTDYYYTSVKTLFVGGYTNSKYKSRIQVYYYNYDIIK